MGNHLYQGTVQHGHIVCWEDIESGIEIFELGWKGFASKCNSKKSCRLHTLSGISVIVKLTFD